MFDSFSMCAHVVCNDRYPYSQTLFKIKLTNKSNEYSMIVTVFFFLLHFVERCDILVLHSSPNFICYISTQSARYEVGIHFGLL